MDLIEQEFRVSFRYPVHFTRSVFSPQNPVFRTVVEHRTSGRLADLVAVVDAGVAKAHPGLLAAIEAYAQHHQDVMRLTAPILVVPGGEASERSAPPRAILQRINDGGQCRIPTSWALVAPC
jgi:3-dehydroquinate synthase